jgi:hypothetical protein
VVTPKGTKVAKEPESRYYRDLKNENVDMRRLLSDPKALKEYVRNWEGTPAPEQGTKDDIEAPVKHATLPDGQVDATKLTRLMDERAVTKMVEESVNTGRDGFATA